MTALLLVTCCSRLYVTNNDDLRWYTSDDLSTVQETDKAVIDVEAQDDGIMGKILVCFLPITVIGCIPTCRMYTRQVQDGQKNIPVGKAIALLAEEGDDISNIEVPENEPEPSESATTSKQEQAPSSPQSAPTPATTPKATHHVSHSRPLFPSVARLLHEYSVRDPEKIKGTGVRGMLTKGDVLAFLGKASSPTGTFKPAQPRSESAASKVEAKVEKVRTINLSAMT